MLELGPPVRNLAFFIKLFDIPFDFIKKGPFNRHCFPGRSLVAPLRGYKKIKLLFSDNLGFRIAGQVKKGLVGSGNISIHIANENRIQGGFDEFLQFVFRRQKLGGSLLY